MPVPMLSVWGEGGPRTLHECAVLSALALSVDPVTGLLEPSIPRLAQLARVSPTTARVTIPLLVAGGWIETEERPGCPRRYRLLRLLEAETPAHGVGVDLDGPPRTTLPPPVESDPPQRAALGSSETPAHGEVVHDDPPQRRACGVGVDGLREGGTPTPRAGVGLGTVSVQTDLEVSPDPDPRSEEDPDFGERGDPGEREPTSTPSSPDPEPATETHTDPEERQAPPAPSASFLQPVTPPPPKVSPARARKGGHEDIPEAELLPAEREIFEAIKKAPTLAAITTMPARTSRTLVGMIAASRREVEGAYQIVLAEDWLSGPRGKKRSNGHAFLVNFLKNAIERAPMLLTTPVPAEPSEREKLRAELGKLKPLAMLPPAMLAQIERANVERFGEGFVLPKDPEQLRALMRETRANVGKAARMAPPLAPGEPRPPRMPRPDGFPHERFGEAWLPPTDPSDPYNVPREQLFVTKSVVDAQLAQRGESQ